MVLFSDRDFHWHYSASFDDKANPLTEWQRVTTWWYGIKETLLYFLNYFVNILYMNREILKLNQFICNSFFFGNRLCGHGVEIRRKKDFVRDSQWKSLYRRRRSPPSTLSFGSNPRPPSPKPINFLCFSSFFSGEAESEEAAEEEEEDDRVHHTWGSDCREQTWLWFCFISFQNH